MDNMELINKRVREELLQIAEQMAQVLQGRDKVNAVLMLNIVKINHLCESVGKFELIEKLNDQQAQNATDYFTLVLQGMEQFLIDNGMEA